MVEVSFSDLQESPKGAGPLTLPNPLYLRTPPSSTTPNMATLDSTPPTLDSTPPTLDSTPPTLDSTPPTLTLTPTSSLQRTIPSREPCLCVTSLVPVSVSVWPVH